VALLAFVSYIYTCVCVCVCAFAYVKNLCVVLTIPCVHTNHEMKCPTNSV